MTSFRAAARDRSILGGIITGLGGRGIGLLAPFFVMPAMLKNLGEGDFGIWMTVVSITSMATFMDFGIGNGLLTKLSKAFGNDDHPAMRQLIVTGYVTLTLIAFTAIVVLLIGLIWLAGSEQKSVADLTEGGGKQIVIVTAFAFLIGIPISVIQRVMLACQKNVQANAWQIIGSLSSVVCCYGAIYFGLSAGSVVAAYSLTPVIIMLVATAHFFITNPMLCPDKKYLSMEHAKSLMALGSKFFLLSIITSIALNSDNAIVAYLRGPEAVTEYAIPTKLASILGLLVTTLFLPLWAANSEAIERKDYAWVQKTSKRMSLMGGFLVGGVGVALTLLSETIVEIWMGRVFENTTKIVAGFSLMYMLFAIASPFQMILNSIGLLNAQIKTWIVFFVISFSAKFWLISDFQGSWIIPFISSAVFLFCIVPVVIVLAEGVSKND